MQRFLYFVVVCFSFLPACGQSEPPTVSGFTPKEIRHALMLGQTKKELVLQHYGDRSDIVMLNLHDDETTSVQAARKVLEQAGGLLVRLENNNQRLISFVKNGRTYRFDPNRMFSRTGIKASLVRHSGRSTDAAVRAVQAFAKFVLAAIPEGSPTLVALHNNDEGRLSIHSYMRGGPYQADVLHATQDNRQDPDNFFLTTDPELYRKLKDEFNTVLQENKRAKDDGSLSIYYGRRNLSYVNVEAQAGQAAEQERMIRALLAFISKRQP